MIEYAFSRKNSTGRVAEWLKAPVSKTGIGETQSRVQIPPLPPIQNSAYGDACFLGEREQRVCCTLREGFEKYFDVLSSFPEHKTEIFGQVNLMSVSELDLDAESLLFRREKVLMVFCTVCDTYTA